MRSSDIIWGLVPDQIHDVVESEVGEGDKVPTEIFLVAEQSHQGGKFARQSFVEILFLLLPPLLASPDVDDGHDPDDVLYSLVYHVALGSLRGVRREEARSEDQRGQVPAQVRSGQVSLVCNVAGLTCLWLQTELGESCSQ